MTFGEVFSRAWKEYKTNFWEIFKLMLVFYAIPGILYAIFGAYWFYASGNNDLLTNLVSGGLGKLSTATDFEKILTPMPLYATILFSLLTIIMNFFAFSGIISVSLTKTKYNFSELARFGKKNFWSFVGYSIIVGLIGLGLFVLFEIPAIAIGLLLYFTMGNIWITYVIPILLGLVGLGFFIYYVVCWAFSIYIYFDKRIKIIDSLKQSKKIVRPIIWKVIGYNLLFGLIAIGISIIFGIPSFFLQLILMFQIMGGIFSGEFYMFVQFFNQILSLASNFIIIPLTYLFMKYFYFAVKGENKSKS